MNCKDIPTTAWAGNQINGMGRKPYAMAQAGNHNHELSGNQNHERDRAIKQKNDEDLGLDVHHSTDSCKQMRQIHTHINCQLSYVSIADGQNGSQVLMNDQRMMEDLEQMTANARFRSRITETMRGGKIPDEWMKACACRRRPPIPFQIVFRKTAPPFKLQ